MRRGSGDTSPCDRQCAVYENGERRGGDLALVDAGEAAKEGADSFVWLGVPEPSAEEFKTIAGEFGLHELAVEDAINAHQRPKVELYGDTLLVVVKTTHYVDSEEVCDLGELLLFVHPTFIITVRHGQGQLTDVRTRIERRPDLLRHGIDMVLYAILDHVVDGYEEAAQGVDGDIQGVERRVFAADGGNPPSASTSSSGRYSTSTPPWRRCRALWTSWRGVNFEVVPDEPQEYFRDVQDHLRRVETRISGFRELLGSALHANLTQVSMRQNEDMRKISAWVAILAVPTMIAGIYGMNFDNMPELHWRFGYPAVLVVIAIACTYLYLRFKRSGWL